MDKEVAAMPRHVGFIMDGNGRWAQRRNRKRTFGHKKGAEVIEEVVNECFLEGVEVVSLFAFSTENMSRPQEEKDRIFDLLGKFLKKYSKKLVEEKIRLIVSGDLSPLPQNLAGECALQMAKTAGFSENTLNIAINYGAKAEITAAVNSLIREGKTEVTEEDIEGRLYTGGLPPVDLVVRTSGEQRLSNFMLWQCAYAELYFTDVLWPDFHKEEVKNALVWYGTRKRRFGGV